jgi:hypothetical protein
MADPSGLAPLAAIESMSSESTGLWAARTAAIDTEPLGNGFWQVTLAAEVLELVDGAYESTGIHYYELTITDQGGHPVALSAPARVPDPAPPATSAAPAHNEAVPADQAAAAAAFLDAYLTGNGELARFVSTTAYIAPFAQPPYASTEVRDLGADSLGNINVIVEATTERGGHQALEYTLEMTFESGVWEVSNLIAAAPATP